MFSIQNIEKTQGQPIFFKTKTKKNKKTKNKKTKKQKTKN